jgi:hypothetical protein
VIAHELSVDDDDSRMSMALGARALTTLSPRRPVRERLRLTRR